MDDGLLLHVLEGGSVPGPLRATLRVAAHHALLAGHFPGAPLVPGVLLLEAAVLAFGRSLGRTANLVAVDEARWFAPVAPGVEVALAAMVQATADGVSIQGEWQAEGRRVASFTVQVAKGVEPGVPARP
jgi:3-hydroxyacyl-[acyl-carrier-protein] dehydratase